MARARNIKPSFFDNDLLAEVSPIGRLFFIGLWTAADFNGNFEWREKKLKAKILPYDNCDVKEIAINLDKLGFIRFYSDQDKICANIVNFTKHQNPHKNEKDKGAELASFTKESRQVIDLTTLTINRDLSRINQESSTSHPADSLILIPDSCSLNPDSLNAANQDLIGALDSEGDGCKFEKFWQLHPNKVDKKRCIAWFEKHKPNDIEYHKIIDGLKRQIAWRAAKPPKEFVADWKMPITWLNGQNWNDALKPWAGSGQNQKLSAVGQTMAMRLASMGETS